MKKKLSVLIVDDNPNIGNTMTDILEVKGYDVSFVTRGEEAVSMVKEKKYDVIFLDIRMPELNGVETLRRIKVKRPLDTVVMITAFAEDALVDQAEEEGALHILSKPLNIDKIVDFLEKQQILKTIFIIDDDKVFCDSLKDAIEIHSYQVTVVHDAQEAVESIFNHPYGIVLLDIKLNGKNGLEVAKDIREKGYKCAIVLMSAYEKDFRLLLDKPGQEDVFIEKPFEIDDLLKLLNEVSRKRLKEVLA